MQVNNQEIQRPVLFTDSLVIATNEIMNYIVTGIKSVTSNIYTNIIKISLKTKNKHSSLITIGKSISKKHRELRISEECGIRNELLRNDLRQLNKLRRVIEKNI